jgi:hypothetical protein
METRVFDSYLLDEDPQRAAGSAFATQTSGRVPQSRDERAEMPKIAHFWFRMIMEVIPTCCVSIIYRAY